MDVGDVDLVVQLERRDGPLPERSWSHSSQGACRYNELYDGEPCPWCEAERRRRDRQTTTSR